MVNLSQKNRDILDALIARERGGTLERVHFDSIPIEVYHHPECPGVSSTRIKKIVERNFNYAELQGPISSPALAFGNAFHAFMEPDGAFLREYSVGKFTEGKKFIAFEDLTRLEAMARNCRLHWQVADLAAGAKQEWTFFSRDPFTGVLRKCRPDLLKGNRMGDWKTCQNASAQAFIRDCKRYLYRISARYYMDIVQDVLQFPIEEFVFIPVESVDLHDVAFYPVARESLDLAKNEIDQALSAIAREKEGGWTGYPLEQSPIFI